MRDRQRAWCPHCNGALWAPLTPEQEAELQRSASGPPAAGPAAPPAAGGPPPAQPRSGPGYRWIAVRPGPPPPQPPPQRPPGPTPRYATIPRWTLMGAPAPAAAPAKSAGPVAPEPRTMERALGGAIAALGIAALVHALIYALMLINRTTLLNPWIAGGAVWLGRLAGLAAIAAVFGCAVVLTRWLLARRSAAFTRRHLPESRSARAIWAGCLVPVVNLAWAPVFVMELASREGRLERLRKPIVVWWVVWAAATAVAVFATATSRADDAQGIANNVVATVLAYLLGLAAVLTAARVVEGFERRSIGRPAHHWVVVSDGRDSAPPEPSAPPRDTAADPDPDAEPPTEVLKSAGREPAA
ncbi:DUF4328 domain-containing protein [[Mycobacterium] kokjensenii]|uniref:DUF4328 domain-containing protein n=1 Tax=[Mycobacterium] kokjensenii TaxID=3064287 RepID=A0ABN9NGB4_9MYCO|nr:DUF4328 domain-containing protein [Mycolicibacter sp. MU0083]CAJ1505865.1 DUF4328 domain-containing protein [Mycolicibacter sp. MU0083]